MDSSIPAFAAALLDFIGDTEAPRGYNTVFGNNQGKLPKPVTSMTIAEVQKAQPTWTKRFGSSATGRYQFMRDTLRGLIQEQRLDTGAKFNADMQDRLGFALLRRRGYDQFVAGKIGVTEFGKRLAQEWASFPVLADTKGAHRDVKRGQSYYAGDGLNKSLITPAQVEAVLRRKLPGTVEALRIAKPEEPVQVDDDVVVDEPEAVVGSFVATQETIEQVQADLRGMGFYDVGEIDGAPSINTQAAITAFRIARGLPVPAGEPQIDALLRRQLDEAMAARFKKPIAAKRANATIEEVAPKVPEVAASSRAEKAGAAVAGTGVFSFTLSLLRDASDTVREATAPMVEFFDSIPKWVYGGAIVALAGYSLYQSYTAKKAGLEAYQIGARK